MAVEARELTNANAFDYQRVLADAAQPLLYSSLAYRSFLERILPSANFHYFIAYEDNRPVGVMPIVCTNGRYGPVLNSLPFYGSNGGVTVSREASDTAAVYRALLDSFDELAKSVHAVAATVISNPLDNGSAFYEERAAHTFRDDRVAQVGRLPAPPETGDIGAVLMPQLHQKTRNAIRKAAKSDLAVSHGESLSALQTLAELHRENIAAIGGRWKPWEVFLAIRETFAYDRDYRVYTAQRGDETVAGLLVFFYRDIVEYFTPATRAKYRELQPMSLLVYSAMQDAVARGCTRWNWGGTWASQTGVHRFKSRFGARDLPYHYFTRVFEPDLLRMTRSELEREYRFFYVLPFHELVTRNDAAE